MQLNSEIYLTPVIEWEDIFKQQLEGVVESLAYLCFKPSEIAMLCGFDEETFIDSIITKNGGYAQAYYRGKLKYQVAQRITTAKLALQGSPDAEKTMQGYLNKMKEEENG